MIDATKADAEPTCGNCDEFHPIPEKIRAAAATGPTGHCAMQALLRWAQVEVPADANACEFFMVNGVKRCVFAIMAARMMPMTVTYCEGM